MYQKDREYNKNELIKNKQIELSEFLYTMENKTISGLTFN